LTIASIECAAEAQETTRQRDESEYTPLHSAAAKQNTGIKSTEKGYLRSCITERSIASDGTYAL
jgi:hypothetical protein